MGKHNGTIRLGCQTYTWEMLGQQWRGSPDDMLDAMAAAGFAGVEFTDKTIGAYADRPAAFQDSLEKRGLACTAFAYGAAAIADPKHFDADLAGAEKALRFAAHFSVPLCLAGPSSDSRDDYEAKFQQAVRFYRAVAERAVKHGVTVAVHPHSHHTSLVLTPPEYDRLLAATEGAGVMFNPDIGHLLRGGHDVTACLEKYRDRIVHLHLKDVDAHGDWQPLGKGVCDVPALLRWIEEVDYRGWLVVEEESEAVWQDAAGAIAEDRRYLHSLGC